MNRLTHIQAQDYTRLYFDAHSDEGDSLPIIIGSVVSTHVPEGEEAIDVMFLMKNGGSHIFTVWIEVDGCIYGEW